VYERVLERSRKAPKNASWFGNLIAHPDVLVQDGREVHRFRAREVFGTETVVGGGGELLAALPGIPATSCGARDSAAPARAARPPAERNAPDPHLMSRPTDHGASKQ
jgi:hypothetical protein